MERPEQKPVNDLALFFSLLLLALLGGVAFFVRGLTPEAAYPFLFPILVLSSIHPILCFASRFFPLRRGLGVTAKEEGILFSLSTASFCLALLLSVLSETGSFGDALRRLSAGFAYLSALPGAFTHAFFLFRSALAEGKLSKTKKAIGIALLVALLSLEIAGAAMTFLGEMPYALFLLPVIGFALCFPMRALE